MGELECNEYSYRSMIGMGHPVIISYKTAERFRQVVYVILAWIRFPGGE